MNRADILAIVAAKPRATGAEIHRELQKRSRAAKWFGEDSFWTEIFGPSNGRMYVLLWELEDEGRLHAEWGTPRHGSKYRPRYYSVPSPPQEAER